MEASYEDKIAVYKEIRETWGVFYDAQKAADALFDKNIVLLAAGAFGISFSFIDKVVPLNTAVHKVFLVLAWLFFALSLVISLASYLISSKVNFFFSEEFRKDSAALYDGKELPCRKHPVLDRIIGITNTAAFFAFFGGAAWLILFVLLNFC